MPEEGLACGGVCAGLSSELGLSKTDLGLVSSSFTAAYGVAKFAGSVITGTRALEPRHVLSAIGSGV